MAQERKRSALRSAITKICDRVDQLSSSPTPSAADLRTLLKQLDDKAAKIEPLNEAIQRSLEEKVSEDPDAYDHEIATSEEYDDKVIRARVLISEGLERLAQRPTCTSTSGQTIQSNSEVTSGDGDTAQLRSVQDHGDPASGVSPGMITRPPHELGMGSAFRLREFQMPNFDGTDLLSFPGWWDTYKSLVHENPQFTDCQRFIILKQSLSGRPLQLIGSLLTTSENYSYALKCLEESYGDPGVLLGLFVSKLHALPSVKDAKSDQLASLVYGFDQHHTEIRNLIRRIDPNNVTSCSSITPTTLDIVSFFLTPHLLSKLPEDIALRWYEQNTEAEKRYSFDSLMAFLKADLKSRQTCQLLTDRTQKENDRRPQQGSREKFHNPTQMLTVEAHASCPFCKEKNATVKHPPWACQTFMGFTPKERCAAVSRVGVCYNCLSPRHQLRACTSSRRCKNCNMTHHSLLCYAPRGAGSRSEQGSPQQVRRWQSAVQTTSPSDPNSGAPASTQMTASIRNTPGNVLLQVCEAKVSNPVSGASRTAFVLFDSGATHSWITKELAETLRLPTMSKTQFTLQTFGGVSTLTDSFRVSCELANPGSPGTTVAFLPRTTENITQPIQQKADLPLPDHLADLPALPPYDGRRHKIDLVIGADFYFSFMTGEVRKGYPTGVNTVLGWVLLGPISDRHTTAPSNSSASHFVHVKNEERFWDLEELGIKSSELDAPEALITPKLVDGRYEVELPFKSDRRPAMNFPQAKRRLNSLEKKLTPEQNAAYDQKITQLESDGIIEKIEPPYPEDGYLLPHHGVWRKGKLRVVFDASSKDKNGISLNDTLHVGDNLLTQLWAVLLRFRLYRKAQTCDIVAAFHQLSVAPEQRKYLMFLWGNSIYWHQRLPFGLGPSPHLLCATLQHHVRKVAEPKFAEEFLKHIYMDDLVKSYHSDEEGIEFFEKAEEILAQASMKVRHPDEPKILGLIWNREKDTISVDTSALRPPQPATRRGLSGAVPSLFDPCGFLTPYTIRGRLLVQRAWKTGLSWDEPLPDEIERDWKDWADEANCLIEIPRWSGLNPGEEFSLHAFSDASSQALCAVCYLVIPGKSATLLASKARVSPLKGKEKFTIPRAELTAFLLTVRLVSNVLKTIEGVSSVHIWSDSTIVLSWVKNGGPAGDQFVSNRLKEIRKLATDFPPFSFRFVPTDQNPADLSTRGCALADLKDNMLWFRGPAFLAMQEDQWPKLGNVPVITSLVAIAGAVETGVPKEETPISTFSSLKQLVNVYTWCRRLSENMKRKRKGAALLHGPLSEAEKRDCLLSLIQAEQKRYFASEVNSLQNQGLVRRASSIAKLKPQLDNRRKLIVSVGRT